jgi:hypothetical protein
MPMKTAKRQLSFVCMSICLAIAAQSLGCAYTLPVPSPPFQERVRLVTETPERYIVRVESERRVDYQVPTDGRMVLSIPSYRRGCTVYLFSLVKVSDGKDPLRSLQIEVSTGGQTIRKLSVRQLMKLPTDSDGYRLVRVPG